MWRKIGLAIIPVFCYWLLSHLRRSRRPAASPARLPILPEGRSRGRESP